MLNHIRGYATSLSTRQKGVAAGVFCAGFGLGILIGLPRKPKVIVVEPDPNVHQNLTDVKLHEVSMDLEPGTPGSVILDISNRLPDPMEDNVLVPMLDEETLNQVGIVTSPPENDPRLIDVDLDRLRARDALIEEHGFAEGMRLYQEQYMSEEPQRQSIFSGEDDIWDTEVEEQSRSTEAPYVIHKDEFWREEMGYSQTTLTYYVGDDILVDQEDVPVYNHSEATGELKFGHGSGDQNVVYIRNDRLRAEYEIIRDRGSYEQVVLGLQAEEDLERSSLKHSLTRFRPDD